jgi:hypothetical protein
MYKVSETVELNTSHILFDWFNVVFHLIESRRHLSHRQQRKRTARVRWIWRGVESNLPNDKTPGRPEEDPNPTSAQWGGTSSLQRSGHKRVPEASCKLERREGGRREQEFRGTNLSRLWWCPPLALYHTTGKRTGRTYPQSPQQWNSGAVVLYLYGDGIVSRRDWDQ